MTKMYLSLLAAGMTSVCAYGQITSHFTSDLMPVKAVSPLTSASDGVTTALAADCPQFTIVKGSEKMSSPAMDPLTMINYQMSRNDSVFYISWGTNVDQSRVKARVGEIIVGSDGSFYLQNPVFTQPIGTWLKGELSDGTVDFTLPQAMAFAQYEDGTVTRILASVIHQEENTFVAEEGESVVKFSWDGDTLRSIDPTVKIGLILEDTGNWTGYGDWDIEMTVQHDTPSVYNGYADAHDYGLSGYDYNFMYCQDLAFGVKMRIDADKVILSEIPSAPAGSVVIGSIDGDKVSFPTQYLGIDSVNMCHVYFQPLIQHLTFDEQYVYPENTCVDSFNLTINREKMTFTADEDNAYSINCGKGDLLTIDTRGMLHGARFNPFDKNSPATPGIGQIYMYANTNPDWGFACFSYPLKDIDGNYLDPQQLYYRIYLNDDLLDLDTSVYTGFDTDEPTVTDIPFLFNNSANIFAFNWNYMHQIITYSAWDKLGIQMVYKAGGEERCSDIFYSDQTVVPTQLEEISDFSGRTLLKSEYYDLTGRQISNPEHGVYIRIDKFSDKTVRSEKVIL